MSEVPQGPFKDTRNPRKRVEFVQRIVDSFWKCCIRDVFPTLVPSGALRITMSDAFETLQSRQPLGEYSHSVTKIAVIYPA